MAPMHQAEAAHNALAAVVDMYQTFLEAVLKENAGLKELVKQKTVERSRLAWSEGLKREKVTLELGVHEVGSRPLDWLHEVVTRHELNPGDVNQRTDTAGSFEFDWAGARYECRLLRIRGPAQATTSPSTAEGGGDGGAADRAVASSTARAAEDAAEGTTEADDG